MFDFCIVLCVVQELCLHTKLLAPANTPIADFLSRAIEPPSLLVTRNAVQLLKVCKVLQRSVVKCALDLWFGVQIMIDSAVDAVLESHNFIIVIDRV